MKSEKRCPLCKETKTAYQFFTVSHKGYLRLSSRCKPCNRAERKEWRLKNPDRAKEHAHRSYKKRVSNPETRLKLLAERRRRRTGLDDLQYKKIKKDQGHRCAICFAEEKSLHRDLCADHCHVTGNPRGLLCDKCNVVLGYFNDKPEALRQAAIYLEKHYADHNAWVYAI